MICDYSFLSWNNSQKELWCCNFAPQLGQEETDCGVGKNYRGNTFNREIPSRVSFTTQFMSRKRNNSARCMNWK